jgi:hypothetical protein
MKVKETRGRPRKYNFSLKKGQSVTMPFSNGARVTALKYAKMNGLGYRSWVEDGQLTILRIT